MPVADYFAELYVAGRFADAGWNVYFPHRDKGFDFIVSKPGPKSRPLIRPVQVKGKYPTEGKRSWPAYGYVGRLTQLHPDMVLAIPYFSLHSPALPTCVAYMPMAQIKRHSRGYRCQPAAFSDGTARPRRDFAKFFDSQGLALLEVD
jgi:hypothetical protein